MSAASPAASRRTSSAADERHVAVEDDDGRVGDAHRSQGDLDRVASPELRLLADGPHAREPGFVRDRRDVRFEFVVRRRRRSR